MKPHIKSGLKKGILYCAFALIFTNIVTHGIKLLGVHPTLVGICGVVMFMYLVFSDIVRKQIRIDELEAK